MAGLGLAATGTTAATGPWPAGRYGAAARGLHWATAALVAVIAALGVWIGFFEPKDEALKLRLYNVHESLGLTVLALTLARLAWRAGHPPPPLPADLPRPVRAAAGATHAALYALLLAMPVAGFLATNAWGFPLRWFGLVAVPSPIGRDPALAPLLSAAHAWMALALALLLALHAGAALWHHLGRRDGVLRRML